jgi:uncharacterized coiled-coil protein SlyX
VLEQLLAGVKGLVADQQLELERLRVRIHQGQAEVQDYLVRLKNHYQNLALGHAPEQDMDLNSEVMIARSLTVSLSSQLQAAQQHIQHLDNTLTRHQVTLARMQAYVNGAVNGAIQGVGGPMEPNQAIALSPAAQALDDDPVALKAIIEAQRQKIAELSSELGHQFQQQTNLKYAARRSPPSATVSSSEPLPSAWKTKPCKSKFGTRTTTAWGDGGSGFRVYGLQRTLTRTP